MLFYWNNYFKGIHAEENCILEVGTKNAKGSDLYTTLFPCTWCAKVIVAAVKK